MNIKQLHDLLHSLGADVWNAQQRIKLSLESLKMVPASLGAGDIEKAIAYIDRSDAAIEAALSSARGARAQLQCLQEKFGP